MWCYVLPTGCNFGSITQKGPLKKSKGPEKLVAEFLPDLRKKGRKGGKLFQDSCPMDNLWIFCDEYILIQIYPHTLL
jgi:hypothetical protein